MPIEPCRRDAITAAVDAYNRSHPETRLPRPAARLLSVMFAAGDVCQQSLDALAAEGFKRENITKIVRILVVAGLLSRQVGTACNPSIYRLHVSALAQP